MRALAEILEVADDAQLEGRTSMVDDHAIVEAAGTLRRIANRLASIANGRIVNPVPQLDPVTESAREAVFDAIRRHLQSWLEFFSGPESLNAAAAQAVAHLTHSTTCKRRSIISARDWKKMNSRASHRGRSSNAATSWPNCTRCAGSNS